MKKIFKLLASVSVLIYATADAYSYSRYQMPSLPTDSFAGPVQILSEGLDEERVGSSTYSWTVRENSCRTVSLTLPVNCREVDDGAYGALYCDAVAHQAGVMRTISDNCTEKPLNLSHVPGFSVLPLACSYKTIYELLGTYLPAGQIEGVQYISLNRETLAARASQHLATDENKQAFTNWLSAQKNSDLRMRAKEVRFNQWGGQGADEWLLFCSKNEAVIYLLQRNLWSE